MKTTYHIEGERVAVAILDTTDYYGEGLYITRVNVLPKHRGKGLGTQVLLKCLADADKEKVTLFLESQEDYNSPLNNDALVAWYERHGFKRIQGGCMFRRMPL